MQIILLSFWGSCLFRKRAGTTGRLTAAPEKHLTVHFPRATLLKGILTQLYINLITADSFSTLHRLKTDEIFHFYLGDPVLMLKLHPDGSGETITLGNNLAEGHQPQCVVTGGTWQGMKLLDGGRFALMGTTMAPAFDFRDFEKGKRITLIEKYPGYAQLIESLTIE